MKKNSIELVITSLSELESMAIQLIEFFGDYKMVMFEAPMGAGKTTLIKAICKVLGSTDSFTSPTYSLVNEYTYKNGKIFHFDLYRLASIEELLDIGIEEYIDSNQYCFVEWPAKMIDIIDVKYIVVELSVQENNRYIRATKIDV